MRNTSHPIVLAIFFSGLNAFAADSTKELAWSSVNLEGAHLRSVSPKEKGHSTDLNFGKEGTMTISSCNPEACVGLVNRWKIEHNRLKMGYGPSEGAALIEVAGNKLTLREASGRIVVYEMKSRERFSDQRKAKERR